MIVESRRRKFHRLPERHKDMVKDIFEPHLAELENGIEENAFFLETAAEVAAANFDAPRDMSQWAPSRADDADKVNSTLRQVYREWSREGKIERDQSFQPILSELESMYPDRQERHSIRVLVPGCGLGRLPLELAALGFKTEGNEFSYHMLFTSSFILNHIQHTNDFRIRPHLHGFSHNRTRQDQLHAVLIPDVSPTILLQHEVNDDTIPEDGLLSMSAGSFDMIYRKPEGKTFNVITTVFFLDTAANIFNTLQSIYDTLEPGGVWINFGPLLWHYEDVPPDDEKQSLDQMSETEDRSRGLEFALNDLIDLIQKFGFKFEKRQSNIPCSYTHAYQSMGGFIYKCEYWVARKP